MNYPKDRRSSKYRELPRSVSEARALEVHRYFTGLPCPQGHIAPKSTSNQRCIECDRLRWHEAKARRAAAKASPPPPPLVLETPVLIAAHLARDWRAYVSGMAVVESTP